MLVDYSVCDPCGNITVLVKTPVNDTARFNVASYLMEKCKNAEQVGFITVGRDCVNLEMTGGEFCGNACRCSSFITGKSIISCCGYRIKCEGSAVYIPKNLEGIEHIVMTEMIENPEEEIKKRSCGNALGFMFLDEHNMFLKPLVYVPGADTLYWEKSCVSGSAVAAEYLCEKYCREIDVNLNQPGGVLNVRTSPRSNFVRIDGDIRILESGKICIPEQSFL